MMSTRGTLYQKVRSRTICVVIDLSVLQLGTLVMVNQWYAAMQYMRLLELNMDGQGTIPGRG
jgi:hypothetical protein